MDNKDSRPTFIESVFSRFGQLFSKTSKTIDRVVFNRTGSLLLTLMLSIGICLSIDYNRLAMSLFDDTSTSSTISNVPVNVSYDSEKYAVSGLPDNVSVTLSGQASDIQLFRQQNGVTVSSNIEKYGEGAVYVDFKVDKLPSTITATITPSSVEVMMEKKINKTFTVMPKLMVGSNQKEEEFEQPILDKTTVQIVGTKSQINTIRRVEAIVDAFGYTKDFTTDATIVAYDSTGNQVPVKINPPTIHASVKLAAENKSNGNTNNNSTATEESENKE